MERQTTPFMGVWDGCFRIFLRHGAQAVLYNQGRSPRTSGSQ